MSRSSAYASSSRRNARRSRVMIVLIHVVVVMRGKLFPARARREMSRLRVTGVTRAGVGRADPGTHLPGIRRCPRREDLMTKTLTVLAVLLACAAPARAQRAHIGPHAGYDFDRNVGLAGGQMS